MKRFCCHYIDILAIALLLLFSCAVHPYDAGPIDITGKIIGYGSYDYSENYGYTFKISLVYSNEEIEGFDDVILNHLNEIDANIDGTTATLESSESKNYGFLVVMNCARLVTDSHIPTLNLSFDSDDFGLCGSVKLYVSGNESLMFDFLSIEYAENATTEEGSALFSLVIPDDAEPMEVDDNVITSFLYNGTIYYIDNFSTTDEWASSSVVPLLRNTNSETIGGTGERYQSYDGVLTVTPPRGTDDKRIEFCAGNTMSSQSPQNGGLWLIYIALKASDGCGYHLSVYLDVDSEGNITKSATHDASYSVNAPGSDLLKDENIIYSDNPTTTVGSVLFTISPDGAQIVQRNQNNKNEIVGLIYGGVLFDTFECTASSVDNNSVTIKPSEDDIWTTRATGIQFIAPEEMSGGRNLFSLKVSGRDGIECNRILTMTLEEGGEEDS